MNTELLSRWREEILNLAEQGRGGEVLDRIDEQPALATVRFASDDTLLIDLAYFPKASAILYRLIELGAEVNHRASTGITAVEQTIWGGSNHGLSTVPELKLLLDQGGDPTGIGSTGAPLLQLALEYNRLEPAKLLLEHGANPDQPSPDFRPETAFDVAKRLRSKAALELLNQFKKLA